MGRVQDKVALVTGAASGLGQAMAERLAEEGAQVVLTDIDTTAGQETAQSIKVSGGTAVFAQLDVRAEARWQQVIDELIERFGRLDILVNNAGIADAANVEETTLADWRRTMAINLDGVFLGTQQAIRVMKAQRSGSIINISSIDGIIGEADKAAYCASKGGVRTFTNSAAIHCAEAGYRIRVNSIHPGYIETPMHKAYMGALGDYDIENAKVVARHPIGFLGQPSDIANAVLYLASDEARFVTGSELVVDGGYLAQ